MEETPMRIDSPKQEQSLNKYVEIYGEDFLRECTKYPAKTRQNVISNIKEAVALNSPTIVDWKNQFGLKSVEWWLKIQLIEVFQYCGVYDKMEIYQIQHCASLIAKDFYYITVTEMMEFFNRFEVGYYSRFFSAYSATPQTLTMSLIRYISEVQRVRGEVENEQRSNAKELSNCISWEEYCKMVGKDPIKDKIENPTFKAFDK